MRILLAVLCFLSYLCPALAEQSVGNGAGFPVASYSVINSTSATVVKSTPGILLGVISTGIQTNALTCYDNSSAASGTILATGTIAAVGNGLTGLPSSGVQSTNGITCQVPTAIVGTVVIFYR